jgi:hypothetical protein
MNQIESAAQVVTELDFCVGVVPKVNFRDKIAPSIWTAPIYICYFNISRSEKIFYVFRLLRS